MMSMLGEEIELARQALHQAKQVRDALSGSDERESRARLQPMVLRSLTQMIELAETLLTEQEKYESRLHRTHVVPTPPPLQTSQQH